MHWDAIGAIAVVVSLAYLASQIRQNTRQLRVAGRQASVDSNSRWFYAPPNDWAEGSR